MIRSPQITLYATDLARTRAFYEGLGFEEAFRFPSEGDPVQLVQKRPRD